MPVNSNNTKIVISTANDYDRESIYRIRHQIYAEELQQHTVNTLQQLQDNLDRDNVYIVAKSCSKVVGFISITLPGTTQFSVDKYFDRGLIPYPFDNFLYEVRLLTVLKNYRSSSLALALMYASYRWIQAKGGKYVVSICRSDILDMYQKAGLDPLGPTTTSGAVTYALATASIEGFNKVAAQKATVFKAIKESVDWQLPCPYFTAANCYHGGAFFKAIGENLQTLHKRNEVINADVLDAWFAPSPKVIDAVQSNLSWLLQTSPPTHADGLVDAIAKARSVDRKSILAGAGSSNLIFLALRYFLNPDSKVLIVDPCYAEYVHVLDHVIGCSVTRFKLDRSQGFRINIEELLSQAQKGFDMVIIVNPNSPTGVYVEKEKLMDMLHKLSKHTMVWIDETYIDYVNPSYTLESLAATSPNIVICKSMSKVYALSGARVAYLCCNPGIVEALKEITPPWSISLPAQLAGISALNDVAYYKSMYEQTHLLRNNLQSDLHSLGIVEIIEGVANFLLFYLPEHFPTAEVFIEECRTHHLFLRDVSNMGKALGSGAIRIAVKDEETNRKMISIMRRAIVKNAS